MTNEELYEIAEYFMNGATCMSYNYAGVDIKKVDTKELKNAIKDEFSSGILGICGCGTPEIVRKGIYDYLTMVKNRYDDPTSNKVYEWIDKNWQNLCIAYYLDDKEFTEHGTGIGGCWITKLGEWYLKIFDDGIFDYEYPI